MAISFVGISTAATAAGATSTSVSPSIPAGVVAGDLLILNVNDGADPGTITGPTGWTLLRRTIDTGTAPAESAVNIYWKAATGSDSAPTFSCTTSTRFVATLAAYRGVDTTTPFLTENAAAETGSSSTTLHTAPTLTNTDAGAWGLYALTGRTTPTPYTATPGTGLTERADAEVGNSGSTNVLGYWADSNGTVATGSVTYSATASGGSAIAVMWAGLLKPAAADTTAPTVPSGVTATAASSSSITVSWTASTDAVGVASYRVKRGATVVASAVTSGTSFTDTGLTASTSYSYTVSAVDAAGNRSAESSTASATTLAGGGGGSGITKVGSHGGFGTDGATSVTQVNPAGVVSGDLLITAVGSSRTGTGTITTPSGWALLIGPVADAQAGDGNHYVFTRTADGTAADTPTWTSAATSDVLAYLVVALRGATVINQSGYVTGTGSPTNGVAMTTTVDGCYVVNFIGDRKNSADTPPRYTPTDTTHWTADTDLGVSPGPTGSLSLRSMVLTQTTAGVVPPQTYTQSSSTNGYVITQVAAAPGSAPAAPGTFTSAWVGIPDGDSVPVKIRTTGAASVRVKVATNAALTTGASFTSAQTPDASGYTGFVLSGLSAGTTYWYAAEVDGVLATTTGTFTTDQPGTARNFRVAFGSCLTSANATGTAFTNALANNPELFIHLGDFHYDNNTSTDPAVHRASIEQQFAANTALATLARTVPMAYTPSDHDSGNSNWSGGPRAWTPAYLTSYAEVVPVEGALPTGGVYRSFGRGRVKFILTDSRSFKTTESAPDDASKTMFGFTQEAWIASELADPAYPVKVICLDVPWVAPATAGEDNWGGYKAAAQRLANAVTAAKAHVFLIHGDSHMLAADDGSSVNNTGGLPVACAAPFGNSTSIKGGPYSQGTYTSAPAQFHGLLDVTDTGGTVSVRYSGRDASNTERVTLTASWVLQSGTVNLGGTGSLSLVSIFGTVNLSGTGSLSASGTVHGLDIEGPHAGTAVVIGDGGADAVLLGSSRGDAALIYGGVSTAALSGDGISTAALTTT